jgi:hypothetical protein
MALIRFRDSGPKPFGAVGAYEKLPCTSEAPVPDSSFGKPVKPSLLIVNFHDGQERRSCSACSPGPRNFSSYETLAQPAGL